MRPLAEQLHVGDTRQPLEHLGRAISISGDDFHHVARQARAQAAGRVEREEPPFVQQRDARAPLRFVEIRRRHQNRDALREKLGQQLPELAARHRIDAGRRLVEQDDPGLVHERACERQLLFHPAGQLIGQPRAELRELRQLEQPLAPSRMAGSRMLRP